MKTLRGKEGFTLLELLMVVIIIAILAAIALPNYLRATERSRLAQVLQLMSSVRGSEMRFKTQSAASLYDNSAGLANLDLAPLPVMPVGWAALAVSGTVAGSNVTSVRNGGPASGATLTMDLDTGNICASTAAAGTVWNISGAAC